MKHLFKQKIYFLFPYILFLIGGAFLLFVKSKAEIHLFINQFHNPTANIIFRSLTHLGDGYTALVIFFILLFIRYRYALIFCVSSASAAIVAQLLKYSFDQDRPLRFFEGKAQLYFVPGVDMNQFYSFPSGHTTTAFATFFTLALFAKNNYLKTTLFILAILIGFSRVYLSQHFFQDIYVGSIVGTLTSFIVFFYMNNSAWLNKKHWADKTLLNMIEKK